MSIMRFEGGGREVKALKQMRETRFEHAGAKNGAKVLCGCGCGKSIDPTRPWHKYASDKCRLKAWKSERVTVGKLVEIEARLQVLESKLNIK